MNESKKIVIIIPSLQMGGAERFVSELANHWAKLGHQLFILTLTRREVFYTLNENVALIQPYNATRNKYFAWIKNIFFLRKNIKNINPSFILNVGYISFIIVALFGFHQKLFISNRSNPYKKRNTFYKIARYFLYSLPKGMIAQTSDAKSYFSKFTRQKNITVIPNFIPKNLLKNTTDKENIILTVGRLIGSKNIDGLIEIFNKTRYENWNLVIAGDGPKRSELRDLVSNLGISENVEFLGSVSDMNSLYQKSKIFAFTSLSEGYPNALLEAMTTPLACISYDCNCGPKDIINDGKNGYLVTMGDEKEYVRKLQELMDNADLRSKFSNQANELNTLNSIDNLASNIFEFCTKKSA